MRRLKVVYDLKFMIYLCDLFIYLKCGIPKADLPLQIEDLKRFIKLVHIYHPGQQPAGRGSPNVGSAQSLAQLFS
jgi:hypothetical protein